MTKHLKTCSCGRRVFRFAVTDPVEMCATCYYHANKERLRALAKLRAPCQVDGCSDPSVAKGYCDKHYRRFAQYGTATPDRAENWGQAHGHPSYDAWRSMRTAGAGRKEIDPDWGSFWQFVRDMGEKPTPRHTLRRRDASLPYSKANCYWREPNTDIAGLSDRSNHAAYMKVQRAGDKRRFRGYDLKKSYGITVEQYEEMHKRQNGLCAICGKPERRKTPTGDGATTRSLCVDHCHTTKQVRELLCGGCNTMIGYAEDNPHILEAAIAYLKKHATKAA